MANEARDHVRRSGVCTVQLRRVAGLPSHSALPSQVPPPYFAFEETKLPTTDRLWAAIQGAGFPGPSVIQAQAWPPALEGRDVIGVAKTGSGKTLGFLIPAFLNIINQTWGHRDPRYGPVALVLAPTRELATQIEEECVKFGRSSGM